MDRVFQIFNPAAVTISDLTVQNGLIAPGDGAGGGGILNFSFSLVQLQRLILQNNHALESGIEGSGGALLAGWGTETKIIDSALYNNSANFYSAIMHQDGHMQLINSTVYANSGPSAFGAVKYLSKRNQVF